MKMLLLAPHQDDEILCACGLIHRCRRQGIDVFVLFATNGDRFGADVARQRYVESCKALAYLGVPEDHILYMGFGDTGMSTEHSFLTKLRSAPINRVFSSYVSSKTYHPAGKKTVRILRTGSEGNMSRESFLADLTWVIEKYRPDLVLGPSIWDKHGDHSALAGFLIELLPSNVPHISYLIHGGDDTCWPQRNTCFFEKPPILPQHIWEQRITTCLSEEQQLEKYRVLMLFSTQIKNDATGFIVSFAKKEEVFLRETYYQPIEKIIFS